MLLSIMMTITLVGQMPGAEQATDQGQTFAERLKASHEQEKPTAIENEDEAESNHAARAFQIRMTQTVAKRK